MKREKDVKVVVLLATYNGEKYIEEQINSIYNQDFTGEILVYIRDDGSKDNTEKVLERVEKRDKRSFLFSKEENIGPQKSFLKLIEDAPKADYYFFADQDDVWMKHKIQSAVNMMQNQLQEYVLYCSDYALTDGDLNVVKEHTVNVQADTFHFLKTLLYNQFPGCVMGFNYNLLCFLRELKIESCMMHDSLALAVAAAVGIICYDKTPSIYHRIHDSNVIGHGHKKIEPTKWIVEKWNLLIKKENYDMSEIADRILSVGKDKVLNYKNDIMELRDFKKSYLNTFQLLSNPDTKDGFNRTALSIRCKILFHIF